MSPENEMRSEYDVRGGVRGKYFAQYHEVTLIVNVTIDRAPTWVRLQEETVSIGIHPEGATRGIGVDPAYQTQMPLTGAQAVA